LVAQGDNVTGSRKKKSNTTIHPKLHAHVMLTQMNIRDGLLAFGDKGNEAIIKEL